MHPYVRERLPQLTELCRQYHVKRLDLFGSGTGERFDPARSDLDFLVEYLPEGRSGFEPYIGFKEDAEKLFGRSVDLVEPGAIDNRFFKANLERSKELVYGG